MKLILKFASLVILSLAMLIFTISCSDKSEPPHVHNYGEWLTDIEPTFDSEGSRHRICEECQETETETLSKLVASYYITVNIDGEEQKIPLLADGAYELSSAPEKIGYGFKGYFDANGTEYSLSGTVSSSVTVYAKYEILPTTTFAELKSRIQAGVDILIAGNITLENTIFVADKVTIYTNGEYTLTRAPGFLGDLFIIGCYEDGTNTILHGKTASLTIKPESAGAIIIDGNKNAISDTVTGTAFLLKNSAVFDMHENVKIINCKKTGNGYLLADGHNMSDPALAGGAAVIITNGTFNMYGGEISDCEVNMNDSAVTPSEEQTEGYNNSSRGGAIFNYGTFNMHGGVIKNCKAGRGGALYNYRISYLSSGAIQNNHSASYGGAFYNPNSQYIYAVIGQDGTEIKMTISGNTAGKTGGAIFTSQQSTVYVKGGTLFKENKALSGNGGAINAAGAVVVDYASFEKNTASSKGGAIYAYYNSPDNSIRLIQLKNAEFIENEAPRGGALAFSCGDDVTVGAKAEIGCVTFKANKAPLTSSDKYGYGAAIHIDQASTVVINGSATFIENVSANNGGAIYITKSSTLDIKADKDITVTFKDNVSTAGNAGAIYNSNSTVTIRALNGGSALFNGNEAKDGNGGAFAVHSNGMIKLYGITATENTALGNGGALYVYGGNAVIDDNTATSSFTSNSADKGGAIYIGATSSNDASVEAYSIVATSNSTISGGGAIYIIANDTHKAKLNVTSLTVSKNEAAGNGGALYIYTSAEVNIESVIATENKTTADGKFGGFAYISGASNTTINTITASGNSASSGGCIYLTAKNTVLTVNSGNINGNNADSADKGNAIWVNSANATLKLKVNSSDEVLLTYTEGEILGVSGFEITNVKEENE